MTKTTAAVLKLALTSLVALTLAGSALAQPGPGRGTGAARGAGAARGPMTITPDARVEQVKYHFADTNEDLSYVRYVSSKVSKDAKAPLIVALHGLGGDGNFLLRDRLVDLAEEGGYIVVAPLGYNVSGWYGSPVINMGGGATAPANLAELSEKDVMNVLRMTREQYNVDEKRTFLLGHSMGGAGALFLGQKHTQDWAAIAAIAPAAFMMEQNRAQILAPLKERNVPLVIVQGDADTVVPAVNVRRWAQTMEEIGLEGKYLEIPGGDHGTVIRDGMPDIFKFFAEHPKTP